MPVPTYLETLDGVLLHTESVGAHTHLVVEDHSRVATQFRANALTTAGTAIVVTPPEGTAIVVTDISYSADKVNGGSLRIEFTDGSNAVILKKAIVTDAPVDGHIAYAGRALGWQDARIDMVNVGTNLNSDVTVFYYFIRGEGVLSFTDWDAQR